MAKLVFLVTRQNKYFRYNFVTIVKKTLFSRLFCGRQRTIWMKDPVFNLNYDLQTYVNTWNAYSCPWHMKQKLIKTFNSIILFDTNSRLGQVGFIRGLNRAMFHFSRIYVYIDIYIRRRNWTLKLFLCSRTVSCNSIIAIVSGFTVDPVMRVLK